MWFFALIVNPKIKYKHSTVNTLIIIYLVVMLFSTALAKYYDISETTFVDYFNIAIFFILLNMTVDNNDDFKKLILGYFIIMFIYQALSVREYFYGRHRYDMGIVRMCGWDETFGGPNDYAAAINYSLPIALLLLKNNVFASINVLRKHIFLNRFLKYMGYIYIPLSVYCVIMTGSRAGYVTMLLLALLILLGGKFKIQHIIVISFALYVVWIFMPLQYLERFATLWDPTINKSATLSAEGRMAGFYGGFRLFLKEPLFGYGPGGYAYASGVGFQTHNLYSQIASEMGICGLISFFMFVLSGFFYNRRVIKYYDGYKVPKDFNYYVAIACINALVLLVFVGNFSHTAFRYQWLMFVVFSYMNYYYVVINNNKNNLAGNTSIKQQVLSV